MAGTHSTQRRHLPVEDAVSRIRAWGEERDWTGHDPYDALNSPLAPFLTVRTALGRRVLAQVVKRSPLNLRPLLGIRPEPNAKAIGLVAAGYVRLWHASGDEAARAQAGRWLDWLVENEARVQAGAAWGYHFDVQTRFFFYPRNSPNTIATSFAAQALLDGALAFHEQRWLDTARDAARFLIDEMLVDRPGGPFFRYVSGDDTLIHNANLLACAVLARTARAAGGDAELERLAAAALPTTLQAQRDDGSWPYSADKHDWVDNFHTGYVLESLAACVHLEPHVAAALDAGIAFWARELFLPDGRPRYFAGRAGPSDAHNYAQAIETWLAVADRRSDAEAAADRLGRLLIDDLLAPAGFVYLQPPRALSNRVPFVRWTTAPAFKALAGLLARPRLAAVTQPALAAVEAGPDESGAQDDLAERT